MKKTFIVSDSKLTNGQNSLLVSQSPYKLKLLSQGNSDYGTLPVSASLIKSSFPFRKIVGPPILFDKQNRTERINKYIK